MMKVDFQGGRNLEADFRRLKDKATARRVGLRALNRAAEIIRDRAKELAPDDPETGTGNYLREAIKIGRAPAKFQKLGNSGSKITTYVGIDPTVLPPKPSTRRFNKKGQAKAGGGVVVYSVVMEMGSKTHTAQPYLRPAFDEKKQEALEALSGIIREEIEATVARAARKQARAGN